MLKRLFPLLFIMIFTVQCELPEPSDIFPPVTLVIYPYPGAVVSDNIQIRVEATDDTGVKEVWIYLDGDYIGNATARPFLIDLDITAYKDNLPHVLQAAASDKDGNIGWSAPVTFTIADSPDIIPPVVSILNPQGGQTVENIVRIVALADDERSVQRVAFYIDGDSVGESYSEPYDYFWDTSQYADSTNHTIYAKAFDGGNNSATSGVVVVTVLPSTDNIPPSVLVLYPIAGTTVSGTVNIAADANDNIGVQKVEFYIDGVLQHTDNSAPWGYAWDTTPYADGQSHSIYVKAYDQAGNAGASGLVVVTVVP